MATNEAPKPPYILLFEEVAPGALPFVVLVDDRAAVPLFDSENRAEEFLASTGFEDLEAIEVSRGGLIRALKAVRDHAGYVALNPPPASKEGGMKVRMGGLRELVEALQTNPEDDLFNFGV